MAACDYCEKDKCPRRGTCCPDFIIAHGYNWLFRANPKLEHKQMNMLIAQLTKLCGLTQENTGCGYGKDGEQCKGCDVNKTMLFIKTLSLDHPGNAGIGIKEK